MGEVFRVQCKVPEEFRLFNSVEEVFDWAESERKSWEWLTNTSDWPEVRNKFSAIKDAKTAYFAKTGTDNDKAVAINRVRNEIQNWSSFPAITSESAFFDILRKYFKTTPVYAAEAIRAYSNKGATPAGSLILALFESGAFSQPRQPDSPESITERMEKSTAFFAGLNARLHTLEDDRNKEFTEVITACRNLLNEMSQEREALQSKLSEFENFVFKQIALAGPSRYWNTLHTKCKRNARNWAIVFATLLTSGLFVVCTFVAQLMTNAMSGGADKVWPITVLFLIIALFAWPLRLISKVLMSNLHVATDARERAVMAQAYLALLKKQAITEKDSSIVLASLFRTSATGIVSDDGPSGSLDVLLKMLTK